MNKERMESDICSKCGKMRLRNEHYHVFESEQNLCKACIHELLSKKVKAGISDVEIKIEDNKLKELKDRLHAIEIFEITNEAGRQSAFDQDMCVADFGWLNGRTQKLAFVNEIEYKKYMDIIKDIWAYKRDRGIV